MFWMKLDYLAEVPVDQVMKFLSKYKLKLRDPLSKDVLWSGMLDTIDRQSGMASQLNVFHPWGVDVFVGFAGLSGESLPDDSRRSVPDLPVLQWSRPLEIWLFFGEGSASAMTEPKWYFKVVVEPGKEYGGWIGNVLELATDRPARPASSVTAGK